MKKKNLTLISILILVSLVLILAFIIVVVVVAPLHSFQHRHWDQDSNAAVKWPQFDAPGTYSKIQRAIGTLVSRRIFLARSWRRRWNLKNKWNLFLHLTFHVILSTLHVTRYTLHGYIRYTQHATRYTLHTTWLHATRYYGVY